MNGLVMKLNKFYGVRWFNSKYYTSVNTIDYVLNLKLVNQPDFYKFLIYELIETHFNFAELTRKLPFDKNFKRISSLKLHSLERAKLKYHLNKIRESNQHQIYIQEKNLI
jgi:hypothetical protein